MQLVDATQSHPVVPPTGGLAPAPTGPVAAPTDVPNTTWAGKVPAPPPEPVPTVKVGSDAVGKVVEVRSLSRDPYIQTVESPTGAFLQNVLGYAPRVEAVSHGTFTHTTRSGGIRTNMLLAAADYCFQAHIPFGLRPEVLWYTIMSQVAAEVKSNPDAYRSLFTTSAEGKETIQVQHAGLRLGNPYGWDQAIGMFEAPLRAKVPGDLAGLCLPDDLSTCGTCENLANLVAFMDAASPYYDYQVMTMCGIPKVALFGSGQDWANLAARVDLVAPRFPGLASYFDAVRPVLAEIAKTASDGLSNRSFWDSVYKRNSGSGGDRLTGWITVFFAFLSNHSGVTSKRTRYDLNSEWGGINPAAFPSSVSAVPFTWNYFGTELPMQFCGGVLTNADVDGFMTPRLGWAVVHANR
jgi:hypothetical protein